MRTLAIAKRYRRRVGRRPGGPARPGPARVHVGECPGALHEEGVEMLDHQPRVGDQPVDLPVEVAAAGQPLLQGREPVLPAADPLVGRPPVLDEVQRSPRAQDPAYLADGALHAGDGAQSPGGQDRIDAAIIERQALPVEADVFDRHRAVGHPAGGQPTPGHRRVDRPDPGHRVGVVGDVATGAESHLQHLACQPGRRPPSEAGEGRAAQGDIDQSGKNLALVQSHPPHCGSVSLLSGARRRGRLVPWNTPTWVAPVSR